ncbi:MAG: hypothetical protein KBD10_01415, partial [Candidatus Pacebacteria bacterium]|nr:hypothetical protein [Candidatus Paceibacterota bacterium]
WTIVSVVLVLIIIGLVILKANKTESPNTEKESETEQSLFDKTIDVKHQYKDGKHIFAGVIAVPSPCYKVDLQVNPGDVAELRFTTTNSGGVCEEKIVDANFYTEFQGNKDLLFVGFLNGEPINLNTFEVDADLDINSINIFNKG